MSSMPRWGEMIRVRLGSIRGWRTGLQFIARRYSSYETEWTPLKICSFALSFLAIAWLLSSVYWQDGFPYTHDGVNHLARFANYAAAVREGQWPPRFAPYILNGYGFPVFTYNYPLANIVAIPWMWLGFNPQTVFAGQVTLALWLGIMGVYRGLRWHFAQSAAWFGVGVFVSSGYLFNLLFWRGNIGEIWTYALVPLSWWLWQEAAVSTKSWWRQGMLAILGATVLLSHNLLGLASTLLLMLLTFFFTPHNDWRRWWGVNWLLSIGLSLWFWLPALGEINTITLADDPLSRQAPDHLLRWAQLGWRPIRFGFSHAGGIDTIALGIGGLSWLLLTLSGVWLLLAWWKSWRTIKVREVFTLCFITVLLGLWASSTSSQWLWDSWTLLSIWQFPWRLHFFVMLSLVPLGALLWQQSRWFVRGVFTLLLIFQLIPFFSVAAVDRFDIGTEYYLGFPMSTLTNNENRPRTFTKTSFDNWMPTAQILQGNGMVTVDVWRGSSRRYEVLAQTAVTVVEPTVYFPGWQVIVDGQRQEVIFNNDTEGQIAYVLPERPEKPYQVETRFTQNTPWRQWGNGLSLVALLSLIILMILQIQGRWRWQ